jgi:hypothetical protein
MFRELNKKFMSDNMKISYCMRRENFMETMILEKFHVNTKFYNICFGCTHVRTDSVVTSLENNKYLSKGSHLSPITLFFFIKKTF